MRWKRGLTTLALLSAAFATYVVATLPPRAVVLTAQIPPSIVFGAYHIHTRRSDGADSIDDIATAAGHAGLRFVIITDHGDATRVPDPPAYRQSVLIIDAVEVSTAGGHTVALNLTKPSPYPLAGKPADVLDDIHRLGGWAVVAHPDSPKDDLRWSGWDTSYDGVEWLNVDSEWRDESSGHLTMSTVRSLIRGPESVAALFSRPSATIERWDVVTRRRSVFALAAIDTHGRIPWARADIFRTIWQAVDVERPLSGDARDDARRVLTALHDGRTFTIVAALAAPAALEFTAVQSGATTSMGGRLDSPAEATFRAAIAAAPDARLELRHDGRVLQTGQGSVSYTGVPEPGAYRVEAFLRSSSVPWIFSNPIYVGPAALPTSAPEGASTVARRTALKPDGAWVIEHAPASSGAVAVDADELRFTFSLDATASASPFAALGTQIDAKAGLQNIEFVGRAERPMRISVQVRAPGAPEGWRWRRSVYLDERPRRVVVPVAELEPVGAAPDLRSHLATLHSVLFVVDTVNTVPGTRGTVWLSNVSLGRGGAPN